MLFFSSQSCGVLLQVRCKHALIQQELGPVGVSETKPKKLKINQGRLQALGHIIATLLFCRKKTKVKASLPTKGVNGLKNYVSARHGIKAWWSTRQCDCKVEEEIFLLFLLFQISWLCIPIKMKADTEWNSDGRCENGDGVSKEKEFAFWSLDGSSSVAL